MRTRTGEGREGDGGGLGRDAPVDDVEHVQVLERAEELGGVEPAPVLVELALALEVVEQLSAVHCVDHQRQSHKDGAGARRTEGHDEVELVRVLERELEGDDERVVHEREHGALREDVRDLARARGDVRLADRLERVHALGVLLADLHDLAEGALADDLEQVEGLDRERLVARGLEGDREVEGAGVGRGGVPLVGDVLRGERGGACVRMREEGRGRGEGRGSEERWTYLGVEDGRQVDARHEEVVAHVVLPLDALRRAQVGRDGDRGRARDVAGRHERARVSYEVDRQSDGE